MKVVRTSDNFTLVVVCTDDDFSVALPDNITRANLRAFISSLTVLVKCGFPVALVPSHEFRKIVEFRDSSYSLCHAQSNFNMHWSKGLAALNGFSECMLSTTLHENIKLLMESYCAFT